METVNMRKIHHREGSFINQGKKKSMTIQGNAHNIFNKVLKFNIYDNGSKYWGMS